MKKKIFLFAFMLCVLSCGIILTACNGSSLTFELKEGASISREYNGKVMSTEEVMNAVEVSEGQEVEIKFFDEDLVEIDSPKAIGNYNVTISIKDKSLNLSFEITKKTLTADLNFEYNGTTQFLKTLTDGVVEGEEVKVAVEFASKNVGSDANVLQVTGADVNNYIVNADKEDANIIPKALKNIACKGFWVGGNNERTWIIVPTVANGLISGENVSLSIKTGRDLDDQVSSIEITGDDKANYSLAKEDITVQISLKVAIVSALDSNTSVNAYVKYGDNKLYSNAFCTAEISASSFAAFGSNLKITLAGKDLIDMSTLKFKANVKLDDGTEITDANGNWVVKNGSNTSLTNFTVNVVA